MFLPNTARDCMYVRAMPMLNLHTDGSTKESLTNPTHLTCLPLSLSSYPYKGMMLSPVVSYAFLNVPSYMVFTTLKSIARVVYPYVDISHFLALPLRKRTRRKNRGKDGQFKTRKCHSKLIRTSE